MPRLRACHVRASVGTQKLVRVALAQQLVRVALAQQPVPVDPVRVHRVLAALLAPVVAQADHAPLPE